MASTTHRSYSQSIATALSTELNALANNASTVLGPEIDNTTANDLFMDLELNLGTTSARVANGAVDVYMVVALDGTNYGDANEVTAKRVAEFDLDAGTLPRRSTRIDINIPPAKIKLFARNAATGVSLAATSNTLRYRTHSISTS